MLSFALLIHLHPHRVSPHTLVLHGNTEGGADASAAVSLSLEKRETILVNLELLDADVGGGDADVDGLSVDLVAGDAFNVDDPLATIHLRHLAFVALELATHHDHLIVHANRHRIDVVLRTELLAQRGAHNHTAIL